MASKSGVEQVGRLSGYVRIRPRLRRFLKRQLAKARRRRKKQDPYAPGRVRDITKGWAD